jgi:hypothetical protein
VAGDEIRRCHSILLKPQTLDADVMAMMTGRSGTLGGTASQFEEDPLTKRKII